VSRCSCDDPAYRITDELYDGSAQVRCSDCSGKVGRVSLDALAVFGITADDLKPGTTLGYEVTIRAATPPTGPDPPRLQRREGDGS
jgi:hypothetical protein